MDVRRCFPSERFVTAYLLTVLALCAYSQFFIHWGYTMNPKLYSLRIATAGNDTVFTELGYLRTCVSYQSGNRDCYISVKDAYVQATLGNPLAPSFPGEATNGFYCLSRLLLSGFAVCMALSIICIPIFYFYHKKRGLAIIAPFWPIMAFYQSMWSLVALLSLAAFRADFRRIGVEARLGPAAIFSYSLSTICHLLFFLVWYIYKRVLRARAPASQLQHGMARPPMRQTRRSVVSNRPGTAARVQTSPIYERGGNLQTPAVPPSAYYTDGRADSERLPAYEDVSVAEALPAYRGRVDSHGTVVTVKEVTA